VDRKRDPLLAVWLGVICVLVTAMILIGGATRLTDSGLSITEWNFAKHFVPPLTDESWAREFALYQRTTEYQLQNRGMSLGDFRFIYLWEWGHRFLGQMLGLVFALPYLFFLAAGRLRGRVAAVTALGLLGGLQGAIGWWMVTSGLWGRLDVSSVRLAIHLAIAFAILGFGFWLLLGVSPLAPAGGRGRGRPRGVLALLILLYLQIVLGALVAGSDAGRAYADWPTIGGSWVPSNYDEFTPFWTNFTENLAAVQFHHRMLGYLVVAGALALAAMARDRISLVVAGLALAQAGLGVATVLLAAPLWLSLIHQFGAVLLWLALVYLLRRYGDTQSGSHGAQGCAAPV
jgi:cytochrome c oxidase assembly protein subunit 15